MSINIRDSDFQEKLLQFACTSPNFLKKMAGILTAEEFKPKHGEGTWEAYIVAEKAFEYWSKYREPIGGMLRHEILDHIDRNKRRLGHKGRDKLLDLVNVIRNADKLVAVEAIENKVIEWKQHKDMGHAIREMIDLKEAGELSPRKFFKICKEAINEGNHGLNIVEYDNEKDIERRITRREAEKHRKYPMLMIEQFDRAVRTFPKRHIGIILAKYKKGKSTAAVWLDQVYALQGHNVLHFTLEDTAEDVEDKLDASFAGMRLKTLAEKHGRLRKRLRKAIASLRAKIRVVDGVDAMLTVPRLEEIWETLRNQGFEADTVIVDADEGLEPITHYKNQGGDTRESKEIYKDLKQFAARRQLYLWVTAQTQRGKKNARQMIVTGDDSATDISKLRRCALCIGVGDGPESYGPDGRYIYIAAHRYDRGEQGWAIVGDFERGIFYDKERTRRAEKRAQADKED